MSNVSTKARLTEEQLLTGWVKSNIAKPPPYVPKTINRDFITPAKNNARPRRENRASIPGPWKNSVERDEIFIALANEGFSPQGIANRFGLTPSIVAGVFRRIRERDSTQGLLRTRPQLEERNKAIIKLHHQGFDNVVIAERMGLGTSVVGNVILRSKGKGR